MPTDSTSEKLVYAKAQVNSVLSLDAFSNHIASHGSKYGRSDVYAVLQEAVSCMIEQLLLGNKVVLGDLGAFYCSISSRGERLAQDFTEENITALRIIWDRSEYFKTLLKNATFEYVGTRAGQAQLRRDEKAMLDEGYDTDDGDTTADKDTEPGDQTGGSGSGGDVPE